MTPYELLSLNTRQSALYNGTKNTICKEFHLSHTSFDIIMFLYNHPKYNTAKEICEIRGIKSGIVSVEVEKLVQCNYITKEIDKLDRRKHILKLTEKVNNITTKGFSMQKAYFSAIHEGIRDEDLEIYNKTLEKILENINKYEKEGIKYEQ